MFRARKLQFPTRYQFLRFRQKNFFPSSIHDAGHTAYVWRSLLSTNGQRACRALGYITNRF